MTMVSKFISLDGMVRIASIVSTPLVQDLLPKGEVSPLAVVVMGRAATAAALMISYYKQDQKIGLHFNGDGPLASVFVEASFEGKMRMFCPNPKASLPEGVTQIGAGLGKGILEVVVTLPFQKSPHKGLVEIVTGEVGDDIAQYYLDSQQTPNIVALSCLPGESGCSAAGGYIIELMPGYTDETLDEVQRLQALQPSLSSSLESGADADDLVSSFVRGLGCEKLDNPTIMRQECNCSLDRLTGSLSVFGVPTLKSMVAENKIFDVVCQFCGKEYALSPIQLQKAISQMS